MPTDFSDLSFAGIDYVKSLAAQCNAKIFIVHVIDNASMATLPSVDFNVPTMLRNSEEIAQKELDKLRNECFKSAPDVTTVIRYGSPAREIVAFAAEHDIDLIVIATHGRTGLAHVFMGSIAEKVVRHSPVPVLSVPTRIYDEPGRENQFLNENDLKEQLHIPT